MPLVFVQDESISIRLEGMVVTKTPRGRIFSVKTVEGQTLQFVLPIDCPYEEIIQEEKK